MIEPAARFPEQRRRKYRSPTVWAEVREKYLEGWPAPLLAQQYDVGLGNLRRRASTEGWTRANQARLQEEPNVRWTLHRPGEPVLSRHERALEDFQETWPEVWDELIQVARECARLALEDRPEDAWPMADWALRWRAETFGPECAEADRRRAAERAEARAGRNY